MALALSIVYPVGTLTVNVYLSWIWGNEGGTITN